MKTSLATDLSIQYQDRISHLRNKIETQQEEIQKLQEQIELLSYVKIYDV
jgi:cell division protein FtsL